jgi:hypothetical protein
VVAARASKVNRALTRSQAKGNTGPNHTYASSPTVGPSFTCNVVKYSLVDDLQKTNPEIMMISYVFNMLTRRVMTSE